MGNRTPERPTDGPSIEERIAKVDSPPISYEPSVSPLETGENGLLLPPVHSSRRWNPVEEEEEGEASTVFASSRDTTTEDDTDTLTDPTTTEDSTGFEAEVASDYAEMVVATSPHLHAAARDNPWFLTHALPAHMYANLHYTPHIDRRSRNRRSRSRKKSRSSGGGSRGYRYRHRRYDFSLEVVSDRNLGIFSFEDLVRQGYIEELKGSGQGIVDPDADAVNQNLLQWFQQKQHLTYVCCVDASSNELVCIDSRSGKVSRRLAIGMVRLDEESGISLRSVGDGRRIVVVAEEFSKGVCVGDVIMGINGDGDVPVVKVGQIEQENASVRWVETVEGKIVMGWLDPESGESHFAVFDAVEQIETARLTIPFVVASVKACRIEGFEDEVAFIAGVEGQFVLYDLRSGQCLSSFIPFAEEEGISFVKTRMSVDSARGFVYCLEESFMTARTAPSRCSVWSAREPNQVDRASLTSSCSDLLYCGENELVCFAKRKGWIAVRSSSDLNDLARTFRAHETLNPVMRLERVRDDVCASLAEDAHTPIALWKPSDGTVLGTVFLESCRGLCVVGAGLDYDELDELERISFLLSVLVREDIPVMRYAVSGVYVSPLWLLEW